MMKRVRGKISLEEWKKGWRFLPIFCIVLPIVFWGISGLLGKWGLAVPYGIINLLYYLIALTVICVIFRSFLEGSLRWTFQHPRAILRGLVWGVCVVLVLQVLLRPLRHVAGNLNTGQFALQMESMPLITLATTVILAPVVEESLFRGLVFGSFRKHRLLAYSITTILFCLLHVWLSVLQTGNIHYFVLALEYLAPSVAFCVCYEKSGTIWAPVLLHAGINVSALLSVYW